MASFTEAARVVLQEAGEPLSYREITERALKKGLLTTRGKTPHYTMRVALQRSIASKRVRSDFVKIKRGYFYLDTKRVPIKA